MFIYDRKSPRIPGYDYANRNYYFVTICTNQKECIFGGPDALSDVGKIAEVCMRRIPEIYPQVTVDKFTVMPNHVHAIIVIGNDVTAVQLPSLTKVIGQYKMAVTKAVHQLQPGIQVWQRSFHDHVIRDQNGYEKIWTYIDNNPRKWELDCFYPKA